MYVYIYIYIYIHIPPPSGPGRAWAPPGPWTSDWSAGGAAAGAVPPPHFHWSGGAPRYLRCAAFGRPRPLTESSSEGGGGPRALWWHPPSPRPRPSRLSPYPPVIILQSSWTRGLTVRVLHKSIGC